MMKPSAGSQPDTPLSLEDYDFGYTSMETYPQITVDWFREAHNPRWSSWSRKNPIRCPKSKADNTMVTIRMERQDNGASAETWFHINDEALYIHEIDPTLIQWALQDMLDLLFPPVQILRFWG
jgi:hypothetical protein